MDRDTAAGALLLIDKVDHTFHLNQRGGGEVGNGLVEPDQSCGLEGGAGQGTLGEGDQGADAIALELGQIGFEGAPTGARLGAGGEVGQDEGVVAQHGVVSRAGGMTLGVSA